MNEGEKRTKKTYKRGDVVTFRLLKKQKYGDDVLELLNEANRNDALNVEIIEALKLYAKFKNGGVNIEQPVEEDVNSLKYEIEEEQELNIKIEEISADEDIFENTIENYSNYEDDLASEELFSQSRQEKSKEKNNLNRAFSSLRRF